MGLFDNLGDLAKQHEEQVEGGIEKAGDVLDARTGGRYAEHVDQAQDLANEHLDRMNDDADQDPPQR